MPLANTSPGVFLVRAFAFIGLGIALSSCGGGGGSTGGTSTSSTPAPMLSDFSMTTAEIPQGLSAAMGTLSGTLRFNDADGNLSSATLRIYNSSNNLIGSSTSSLQGLSATSGYLTLSGSLPIDSLASYTFRITVTDAAGNISNEVSALVRIVASNIRATVVSNTGLQPSYLTAINSNLYWTERGQDALKSAPTSGGEAIVRATRMTNPTALAFMGTDMIWLDTGPANSIWTNTCDPASRAIKRSSANGSTVLLAAGAACNTIGTDMTTDGSNVYWASADVGEWSAINSTPVAGGTSQKIFSTNNARVVSLATRSGILYWMDRISRSEGDGAIHRMSTIGGAVTTLVSDINVVSHTFAVDDSAVYYASSDNGSTSTLWAQSLAGGTPVALATGLATPLKIVAITGKILWIDASSVNSIATTGGSRAVLATTSSTPIDLLVNGSTVIWTESTGAVHGETGALKSVPLSGGAVTLLHDGDAAPRQLAIDSNGHINWTEGGTVGLAEGFSRVARLTTSNTVETVLTGLATEAARFRATGTDLYIADGWQIKRLPMAGGLPQIIASADGPIGFIDLDSTSVYWTSASNATVYSAPLSGGTTTTLIDSDIIGTQATAMGDLRVTSNGKLVWGVSSPYIRRIISISASTPGATASIVADITDYPGNILADDSFAYFNTSGGFLSKTSLSGGVTTNLAPMHNPPIAMYMDGSFIYWLGGHGVEKVAVTGGANTTVMMLTGNSGNNAQNLAIDVANIYWTDSSTKQILAVPK